MKNRYYRDSKLTDAQLLNVLSEFCGGIPATQAAPNVKLSIRTVNQIYIDLRKRLYNTVFDDHAAFSRAGGLIWLGVFQSRVEQVPIALMPHNQVKTIIWLAGNAMSARIDSRRLKTKNYDRHMIEIYVRQIKTIGTVINYPDHIETLLDEAVAHYKSGQFRLFRKAISKIPAPKVLPKEPASDYISFYEEFREILLKFPLGSG